MKNLVILLIILFLNGGQNHVLTHEEFRRPIEPLVEDETSSYTTYRRKELKSPPKLDFDFLESPCFQSDPPLSEIAFHSCMKKEMEEVLKRRLHFQWDHVSRLERIDRMVETLKDLINVIFLELEEAMEVYEDQTDNFKQYEFEEADRRNSIFSSHNYVNLKGKISIKLKDCYETVEEETVRKDSNYKTSNQQARRTKEEEMKQMAKAVETLRRYQGQFHYDKNPEALNSGPSGADSPLKINLLNP